MKPKLDSAGAAGGGGARRRSSKARTLAVRAGIAVVLAGVGALSMVIGKGHTVILDTARPKDPSDPPAPRLVSVSLDGREPVELSAGIRELALLQGQKHRYEIDWLDGGAPSEGEFSIPFAQEFVILSLPRLKAGRDDWLIPYSPYDREPAKP